MSGNRNLKKVCYISENGTFLYFRVIFYTFSYEEAKFSKLKYFLIIIIQHFF